MIYRPWGPIAWVLSISEKKQWSFVGCIGTEERSLACWAYLKSEDVLAKEKFTLISDRVPAYYQEQVELATKSRFFCFDSLGGNRNDIQNFDLLDGLAFIQIFVSNILSSGETSVVLDITSFPKRFWFPILKELLRNPQVENLVLTYTSPKSYAPEDEPLYEDIIGDMQTPLPGFGSASVKPCVWVASVGFMVETLRGFVGSNQKESVKLLIPFPATTANLRRTWASIATLKGEHESNRFDEQRVDVQDISSAFDRIVSFAKNNENKIAFAPFGPKPISAAMCLFASQSDNATVHYPQPTIYHPEYTKGIFGDDPAKAVNAYWIKHDGENFYAI